MTQFKIAWKLAKKLKKEAIELGTQAWKTTSKYVADHPWTAAFNTAIAGMSIPDIEEVWEYVQTAIGSEVQSVDEMIELMIKDSNIENLAIEKVNSMMPGANDLFEKIPPAFRKGQNAKAKILADQWLKRREFLDADSKIRVTDDPTEMELRITNIEVVSSFFGVHSDEGIRALHSALRAFVNTSGKSIDRTLQIRKGVG
jgi:hypothetical protein